MSKMILFIDICVLFICVFIWVFRLCIVILGSVIVFVMRKIGDFWVIVLVKLYIEVIWFYESILIWYVYKVLIFKIRLIFMCFKLVYVYFDE